MLEPALLYPKVLDVRHRGLELCRSLLICGAATSAAQRLTLRVTRP
jgi:hypothetical protein